VRDNSSIFDTFRVRKFKKGQLLIFQGEVPRYGYALKSGIIKEYDISKQGNEQTTWLIGKLEVFPLPWLIGVLTTASYYYEVVSDCELYVIEKTAFQDLIKTDHAFLLRQLNRQAEKEIYQTRRMAAILNIRAQDKIIHTFHYLVESYGHFAANNLVDISLPLTHQDIANLTGMTRETVSKEIGILKNEGLLLRTASKSTYTIDLVKLNKQLSMPLSRLDSSE
jgi:CRP/FNR family cyclic AMP-dependent transcriptional regulator